MIATNLKRLLVATLLSSGLATAALAKTLPENFLYTSSGNLAALISVLARPDIGGAQVVYTWKSLEHGKGQYDFSPIERDLALADKQGKRLFVQVQDRFFDPKARNIPDYLLTEAEYGGGLVPQFDNPGENKPVGSGWVAKQWNGALRARYQALLKALAERFDGKLYGINLPETSIDLDPKNLPADFSCDAYFNAEMDNLAFARNTFAHSLVVQYVNFWPCEWENDHTYMGRLFAFAAEHRVGLGGPDIVPNRRAQMKNSYPFFNRYNGKLAYVGLAVQEPTLTYRNPETKKPFTKDEFTGFAQDYLGADVIFWSAASPWLRQ